MSNIQNQVFFECHKIIENMQSIGSWYCICHQYSGCQEVHNFIKNEWRYGCVCQFQDTFNLWELNKIKRQVNRLKNYYMQVLTAVCEIKKLIPSEDNFWEKDIHFVVRNNNVKTL